MFMMMIMIYDDDDDNEGGDAQFTYIVTVNSFIGTDFMI